jgi:putative phosphoesterase
VSSSLKKTGVRVVVLSDTHMAATSSRGHATGGRGFPRRLPDALYAALRDADVVLHAGDVVTRDLLDELATYAPVHAVLGNNDHALVGALPETLELDLDGVRVAMVHDSGARKGRPARMKRRFPDAQVVVYGHSHLPDDSEGVDGQRLFNPGSPTERRRAPTRSFGVLDLANGRVRRHEIVPVES